MLTSLRWSVKCLEDNNFNDRWLHRKAGLIPEIYTSAQQCTVGKLLGNHCFYFYINAFLNQYI